MIRRLFEVSFPVGGWLASVIIANPRGHGY
jgi:hypothetical protein